MTATSKAIPQAREFPPRRLRCPCGARFTGYGHTATYCPACVKRRRRAQSKAKARAVGAPAGEVRRQHEAIMAGVFGRGS